MWAIGLGRDLGRAGFSKDQRGGFLRRLVDFDCGPGTRRGINLFGCFMRSSEN